MGKALIVRSGSVTNPGATFTKLTPFAGDQFTVDNFMAGTNGLLLDAWTQAATGGQLQIRSPKLHDNVHGIRMQAPAAALQPLLGFEFGTRLYPQDALTVEMTGGSAETDLAALLLYYADLPGSDARLAMPADISGRIVDLVGILTTHTIATADVYSGAVALNATDDRLKANTDYAYLGYTLDTAVLTVGVTGPDTGNNRVAGPGPVDAKVTRSWYYDLAVRYGLPMIPIINSANRGGTTVDLSATATGTVNVTHQLAELAPIGA